MPFRSKAQIQRFYQLQKQGKVGMEQIATMAMETQDIKNLPERVAQDDTDDNANNKRA